MLGLHVYLILLKIDVIEFITVRCWFDAFGAPSSSHRHSPSLKEYAGRRTAKVPSHSSKEIGDTSFGFFLGGLYIAMHPVPVHAALQTICDRA